MTAQVQTRIYRIATLTAGSPHLADIPQSKCRPTALSSPAYRDWADYIVREDSLAVGRIYEDRHTLPGLKVVLVYHYVCVESRPGRIINVSAAPPVSRPNEPALRGWFAHLRGCIDIARARIFWFSRSGPYEIGAVLGKTWRRSNWTHLAANVMIHSL